jgi:hypothetical protein
MITPGKFSEIFWPKELNSMAFEVFSLQGIAQCQCVYDRRNAWTEALSLVETFPKLRIIGRLSPCGGGRLVM